MHTKNNTAQPDNAHLTLTSAQGEFLLQLYTDIRRLLHDDIAAQDNFFHLSEELQDLIETHLGGQCDHARCYIDFYRRCCLKLIINAQKVVVWQLDQADLNEEHVRYQQASGDTDVDVAPQQQRLIAWEVIRYIQDHQATSMRHSDKDDTNPHSNSNDLSLRPSSRSSPALQTPLQPDAANEPSNAQSSSPTRPSCDRLLHLFTSAQAWFEGDRGAQDNVCGRFHDIVFAAEDLRDLPGASDVLGVGMRELLMRLVAAVRAVTQHQFLCSLSDEQFIRDARVLDGADAGEFEE
ncbi:hypothetical protein N0V87_010622 [Didymella glomerata]|uniref:Uncharacterized protein n=1 Tax=Didymella glomerata TaxID=749621 RepID=A0A9W8WNY8_9PLEO|nr:hypothetical protein N0V87_010622 [Didymella glomerata]